jgi:hypothetical protein
MFWLGSWLVMILRRAASDMDFAKWLDDEITVGNSLEVGSRGPSLQLAFGSLGASRRKKGSRAMGSL